MDKRIFFGILSAGIGFVFTVGHWPDRSQNLAIIFLIFTSFYAFFRSLYISKGLWISSMIGAILTVILSFIALINIGNVQLFNSNNVLKMMLSINLIALMIALFVNYFSKEKITKFQKLGIPLLIYSINFYVAYMAAILIEFILGGGFFG